MLTNDEYIAKIQDIKRRWGSKLTILAHYYCQDDVVALADFSGDSLGLSQKAASLTQTEAILFCGVYFMAETADILVNYTQGVHERNAHEIPVLMPDIDAGCPMADMVTPQDAQECKNQLSQVIDFNDVTPITYINSSASTKEFVANNNGIVCTSANADKIMNWAFERTSKILFLPDQHLGRNTAIKRGVDPDNIVLWDPSQPSLGGNAPEQIQNAKVILWQGCCPIHQRFSVDIVKKVRAEHPDAIIWVHPECPQEIVKLCDGAGSTTKLIQVVKDAPAGSTLAIGTEWKLVERLRKQNPDKTFIWLGQYPSVCSNMAKSTLPKILQVLESLDAGAPINQVCVDAQTAFAARIALKRMLDV